MQLQEFFAPGEYAREYEMEAPAVSQAEDFIGSLWDTAKDGLRSIDDRTQQTPPSKRVKTRDMSKVKALVLHQMAFSRGNTPEKYLSVTAHFAILPDGRVLQLHPVESYLNASNGFNAISVAVEFAGNFPSVRGKCWSAKTNGCHKPTQAQIDAGRFLVRHLIRTIGLTHIYAHRQSSGSRENDPGPAIWYHVGQWAVDNHGLSDGGAGYRMTYSAALKARIKGLSDGNPIPDEWRTWGTVKGTSDIAPELETGEYLELEVPAVTSQICETLDRFAFNQDQLTADHHAKLDAIAQRIVRSLGTISTVDSVRVTGHTDNVGSAAYNLTLGQKRADAVAKALREKIDKLKAGASARIKFNVESKGETQPISPVAEANRRVEICTGVKDQPLAPLTPAEQTQLNRLSPAGKAQFLKLRKTIEGYSGVARREADRGSRVLLQRGTFKLLPSLLTEIIRLTEITTMPAGMTLNTARPLLVGNTLFNLAFPETINQGAGDRLGGSGDPTCFSASTQILLARRFPASYVRLLVQLATTNSCTFAGGDSVGPLTFKSTSLFKSLDAVLLQTAIDTHFKTKARSGSYAPGDELKVHRQVFGAGRPPKKATWGSVATCTTAFRKAFVTAGGNTRLPEIVNICAGSNSPSCSANHTVVITRVTGGRVYFNNPWPNEVERIGMFGPSVTVSVSGNGERAGEASMTQANFEGQLVTVFHN